MTSPLIYDTGTVTLTHGSTAIVGTGTDWAVAGVRGGVVTVEVAGGNPLVLDTVTDDTHAVAATKWMGPDGTFAYAISLATADAVDTVWASRHWSRVVGQALLAGIVPVASGTLAERDALDPQPANGAWFAHAEPPYDLTFYRKVAAGWEGPFAVRGPGGAPASLSSLTDLSDVTLTSPADGKVLRYDGSQWVDAVLAADDIDDSTSDHKFASAGELAKLGDLPSAAELADALEDKADASALAAHVADDGNPHGVTKAQVGLGAVDNTADADKPLSAAMTSALAAKADAITRAGLASRWIGDELRAAAIDCRAQAAMVRDIYGEVPAVAGRPEDLMAFERLSGGSYVGRDGLMRFAASGEPRYSHDPVTLEPLGLLVERASTNLVAGPSLIAADWTITNSPIITQAATQAPDGSMTGVRWERGSADPYASRATVSYVTGTRYTGGYCFKRDPGSPVATTVRVRLHSAVFGGVYRDVSFNLTTEELSTGGSPEDYGAIRLPGGWWYVWVSHTATETVTSWAPLVWPVTGTVGSSFYIWHAQIEVGARPTSLIRNLITNAVSSRAADTVSVPIGSLPFNLAEGTLLYEGWFGSLPSSAVFFTALRDTAQTYDTLVGADMNTGGIVYLRSRLGSGDTLSVNLGTPPTGRLRIAMSYDGAGMRGSLNGAAVASGDRTFGVNPTSLFIGQGGISGSGTASRRIDGPAGRVVYIPRAFSNGELQAWAGA